MESMRLRGLFGEGRAVSCLLNRLLYSLQSNVGNFTLFVCIKVLADVYAHAFILELLFARALNPRCVNLHEENNVLMYVVRKPSCDPNENKLINFQIFSPSRKQ